MLNDFYVIYDIKWKIIFVSRLKIIILEVEVVFLYEIRQYT